MPSLLGCTAQVHASTAMQFTINAPTLPKRYERPAAFAAFDEDQLQAAPQGPRVPSIARADRAPADSPAPFTPGDGRRVSEESRRIHRAVGRVARQRLLVQLS